MNDKIPFKPRVIWRGKIPGIPFFEHPKIVRIVQTVPSRDPIAGDVFPSSSLLIAEFSTLDALGNDIWIPVPEEDFNKLFNAFLRDHITLDKE